MAGPGINDVYTIIELVIPGFWTYLVIRRTGEWGATFSGTEVVYVSLMLSLVDVIPLSLLTGTTSVEQLSGQTLSFLFIGELFASATLVGIIGGYLPRWTYQKIAKKRFLPGTSWGLFVTAHLGQYVHLRTNSGEEYYGWLASATTGTNEPRELTLRGVERIIRGQDGKLASETKVGDSVFFSSGQVASVWREKV